MKKTVFLGSLTVAGLSAGAAAAAERLTLSFADGDAEAVPAGTTGSERSTGTNGEQARPAAAKKGQPGKSAKPARGRRRKAAKTAPDGETSSPPADPPTGKVSEQGSLF